MQSLIHHPKSRLALTLLGLLTLAGCFRSCSGHSDLSPEDVVQAYLDVAFNMKNVAEREQLLEYTTGPLNEAISAASDEAIREAYVAPKYELQKYSVLERHDRTPRETEITFQVVYKNNGQEGPEDNLKPEEIPTVTVENTLAVVKERQGWLIKEVLNKKSSFLFPSAPEIKAKAAP